MWKTVKAKNGDIHVLTKDDRGHTMNRTCECEPRLFGKGTKAVPVGHPDRAVVVHEDKPEAIQ